MPVTIGFDPQSSRRDEDMLLPPEHRSRAYGLMGAIAGVTSPAREPGIGGVFRAIADPRPVLDRQYQEADRAKVSQILQALEPYRSAVHKAADTGDEQALRETLTSYADAAQALGVAPEKAMGPTFNYISRARLGRIHGLDPRSPDYLKALSNITESVGEGLNVSREGSLLQNDAMNRSQTQQEMDQSGQLFSPKLDEQKLMPGLRSAQIANEQAQTGTEGSRQRLLGEQTTGAGIQNRMRTTEADFMDRSQQKMGTAGAGQGKKNSAFDRMLDLVKGPPAGLGGRREDYAYRHGVALASAANMEAADQGRPERFSVTKRTGPSYTDEDTKAVTPGKDYAVFGLVMPNQASSEAAPPPAYKPGLDPGLPDVHQPDLTAEEATARANAGEAMQLSFELSPQQKQSLDALSAAFEEDVRKNPRERETLRRAYNKRMIDIVREPRGNAR